MMTFRRYSSRHFRQAFLLALVLSATAEPTFADSQGDPRSLKSAAEFADISNEKDRSVALYLEASKVIEDPRCMNCHPVTRLPTQGDDLHKHNPPMVADEKGHGPPGLDCNVCHQAGNTLTYAKPIESIPGHAHWMLAPTSMGWQGLTSGEICQQLKDPERNGGRNLDQIYEHMAKDTLVGWAWNPGAGRKPAPGTQKQFGELIEEWIKTGAECPSS